MELQLAMSLVVLLMIVLLALIAWRRERGPSEAKTRSKSGPKTVLAAGPPEGAPTLPPKEGKPAPRPHAYLGDRIFGGTAAALLIGAIVFVLEISGYGGPLSLVLGKLLSMFPQIAKPLGPLFGGAAIMAAIAFLLGFVFPRMVLRIR